MDIRDAPEQSRYEAHTDEGALAGVVEYVLGEGVITFTHTEVWVEGHGVGGALARHVLDDSRARGLRVVPRCPFIRGWIGKHPDYQDLVDVTGV
jgi:predicted GNAT family acetyltransferase